MLLNGCHYWETFMKELPVDDQATHELIKLVSSFVLNMTVCDTHVTNFLYQYNNNGLATSNGGEAYGL